MKLVRFLLLFLIAGACVDRFNLKTGDVQVYLVVDGLISDQPGPYVVKLSRSRPVTDQLGQPEWVQGATVTISDDAGNSEVLHEMTPGYYETTSLQGVIGNTYKLQVVNGDGSIYESTGEKLLPVGEINKLYFKFEQNEPSITSYIDTKNGFRIYIDGAVLPEQENRIRWRFTGTFQIETYPQLQTKSVVGSSGTVVQTPDPIPCSGYRVVRGSLVQITDCACCDCWITQYNYSPLLSQPSFITGDSVKHVPLTFIPASRRLFYDKYYVEVEQMSLSQPAFDFWSKVAKQEASGSDLFQTPPAKTTGNVKLISTNPGSLPVIGLFSAASIKTRSLTIQHSDIPYYVPQIDTIKQNCDAVYVFNTSKTKPAFY